ncbi:MAG: hypothetical protein Q4A01_02160 [Coriobacteriales bacterium]|nr:hypothetical protein [Coriobacteriales bacterium]
MKTKSLFVCRHATLAAIAALVLGAILALAALPVSARADNSDSPSVPESVVSEENLLKADPEALVGGFPFMGNDYVWCGESLELGSHKVKNDLLAAGRTIKLTDVQAGGSIRAAGESIDVAGSKAGENITVAGRVVTVSDATCNACAAAGQSVAVSGTYEQLTAYGSDVFIDATVEGDVAVGAGNVRIGKNANIKGTLHVSSGKEPVLDQGAKVGKVDFTKTEDASKEVESATAGIGVAIGILSIIAGVVGTFVVAILAEWLFSRHTAKAAEMVRTRTVPTIVSGLVGPIAEPIALILMFVLVITIPVAIAIILAQVAMFLVATGFLGASVFKLVFPKLGRYKCAMAGGAIVAVASAIPFLGALVHVVAFVYLFGYVLQSLFLGIRERES